MNKMNQSNSLVTDRDITFFGEREFTVKDNSLSHNSYTKNSSNAERIYGELNNEITKARESKNIDLNLSNSKNNELHVIDQLLDHKFWNQNNNDTQDSNQYYKKYKLLQKKQKTPRNKTKPVKKTNIQFIPNNNYDYSADTEEFSPPCQAINEENVDDTKETLINNHLINKISSIQPKINDINSIDKQSRNYVNNRIHTTNYDGMDYNKYNTYNLDNDEGFIYPGSFTATTYMNQISINPPRIFGPTSPQKQIPRLEFNAIGLNCKQPVFEMYNNSRNHTNVIPNANSYSNFPVINRGSFISKSTHYSSNNKNKQSLDNDVSIEIVNSSINEDNDGQQLTGSNTYNTVYHSLSDRKVRLPTSESVDSNHSSQYNYMGHNSYRNLTGINLNHKFAANTNNMQFIHDDELRRKFSASFNDNPYYVQPVTFENPFTLNFNNTSNLTNMGQNQNQFTINNFNSNEKIANKQKILKPASDNFLGIKIIGEKNTLNLDDILAGRDKRTTVMIRNIPIKYTDDMLLKELEEFKGKFDCLYLPFDYEKFGNKGYAFINFVHPLHIVHFYEKFEGKTWNYFESKKICELNAAKFQGITEIKRHARNYRGQKKPLFWIILNNMTNLELSTKYLPQFRQHYPNANLEEKNNTFKIKSFDN